MLESILWRLLKEYTDLYGCIYEGMARKSRRILKAPNSTELDLGRALHEFRTLVHGTDSDEDESQLQEQRAEPSTDNTIMVRRVGHQHYLIDGEPIAVESAEDLVLAALLENQVLNKETLENKSGDLNAPRTLRKLYKKHELIQRIVTLPGRRGGGGYRVNPDVEYNDETRQ